MSSNSQSRSVLTALGAVVPADAPDEVLLRRFIADSSDASFSSIVHRHGGLVLNVCRSVLRNDADAEDAFQATFLTLATRARSVRSPAALAAWLHGTAYRTARKARAAAARRRQVESRIPVKYDVLVPDPTWAEVQAAIHEEVNRLPERERVAVVLCYLTGVTQDAAATTLGLTRDGIKKRLERGREMLRYALASRGFGPVAALAAMVALPAAAPAALVTSTAKLATGVSMGLVIPTSIQSLIEGGLKMGPFAKLTAATAIVGALVLTVGLSFGMFEVPAKNDSPGARSKSEPSKDAPIKGNKIEPEKNVPPNNGIRDESAKMRITNPDGSKGLFNDVVKARVGFPKASPERWVGSPDREGVVSLADLPVGTHWLLAAGDSEQRTLYELKVPTDKPLVERRLRVNRSWASKNLDIQPKVKSDDKEGEIILIEIRNTTKEVLQVSEEDIQLTTHIEREGMRGLSPKWPTAKFTPIKIEAGETGTLQLNWKEWVNSGLWASRRHESITEPVMPDAEPGKAWLRVWLGNIGGNLISVTAPSVLAEAAKK